MIESVAYEAALARVQELEAALAAERTRRETAETSLTRDRQRWRGNFGALRTYLRAIEHKVHWLREDFVGLHTAIDEELRQIALLDAQKEGEKG